jgi:integrase/recombinase XerD
MRCGRDSGGMSGGDRSDRKEAQLEALVGSWLGSYGSANTRAAYGGDVQSFRRWCAGEGRLALGATMEDLVRYFASCTAGGSSPATLTRRMSALDSFFDFACDAKMLGVNPMSGVTRPDISATSSTPLLDDTEARALLRASDRLGDKAAALVRLLMLDGLKVGEVLPANADDLCADTASLVVHRRGRASSTPLQLATVHRLRRYLGRRRRGPLLVSDVPGRNTARLTRFGADHILKKVGAAAHINVPISANALRRRYVTATVDGGTGLDDVRDHLGQRDSRTARRYLGPTPQSNAQPRNESKRR